MNIEKKMNMCKLLMLIIISLILALLFLGKPCYANERPSVYCMGDSIMEGYRTYGYGVAQNLRCRYGYTVKGDQSKSGAVIDRADCFWLSQIRYGQQPNIVKQINTFGVDDYTCVVIDGGGNDLTLASSDPNMVGYLDHLRNKTFETIAYTIQACGNTPNNPNNIPIFYLYPKLAECDKQASAKYEWGYNRMIADEKMCVGAFWQYNVVGIDLTSLLLDSDMADDVHPNASGYVKISDYIHFINAYQHYNVNNR